MNLPYECSFSTGTNVHGFAHTVPLSVRVRKRPRSSLSHLKGNVHKGSQFGLQLIKAAEQMVQARSGRNETVNGETNRTWQDSCEGFER